MVSLWSELGCTQAGLLDTDSLDIDLLDTDSLDMIVYWDRRPGNGL